MPHPQNNATGFVLPKIPPLPAQVRKDPRKPLHDRFDFSEENAEAQRKR